MPFNTYLLDNAINNQKQVNEQCRLTTLKKLLNWLDTFGGNYDISCAYIFGSITQPYHFTSHSDVDIAVEKIQPENLFLTISLISTTLERDVDIIDINKCHFADKIRQEGILWMRKT
jgi:hypothetical protein